MVWQEKCGQIFPFLKVSFLLQILAQCPQAPECEWFNKNLKSLLKWWRQLLRNHPLAFVEAGLGSAPVGARTEDFRGGAGGAAHAAGAAALPSQRQIRSSVVPPLPLVVWSQLHVSSSTQLSSASSHAPAQRSPTLQQKSAQLRPRIPSGT